MQAPDTSQPAHAETQIPHFLYGWKSPSLSPDTFPLSFSRSRRPESPDLGNIKRLRSSLVILPMFHH